MLKVQDRLGRRAYIFAASLMASCVAAVASAQQPPPLVIPPNKDAAYNVATQAREKLLQGLTPVDDAMRQNPAPGDWLNWRRTNDAYGRSPLKQIDRSNVSKLQLAWSWQLSQSSNETTPLVHNGVMFVVSGNRVQAFDASSGDVLWQYVRTLPATLNNGSGSINRSMGISGNKLFLATPDRHMIALNNKTGELLWDVPAAEGKAAEGNPNMTGGPLIVKDKVIIGLSNCNRVRGGCYITAFNAETGKVDWRFNTIARTGEPGGDTWNGAPDDERFGGSVWTAATYDPELNMVYVGAAQTYNLSTLLAVRPGATGVSNNDALYTNTTLALDPETGKLIWHYQHFNGEVWDLDWVFERTLMTLRVDGKDRKVVATAGKLGIFDVLDRKTGEYLFSRDLGYQTLVKEIDKKTGRKIIDPKFTPVVNRTDIICPHPGGGRNWTASTYNPATRILYIPVIDSCMYYTWLKRTPEEIAAGGSDIRWQNYVPDNSDGNFGYVQAFDITTGKTLWKAKHRAVESAALLSTDGGVIFQGSRDRRFRALDEKNGATLWETRLPAQPSAYPVTYTANGKQYVAVTTGGGGPLDNGFISYTPELVTPTGGNTLMVFALPDTKR